MSSVPDVSKLPDPEAPLPELSTYPTPARHSKLDYWQRLRYEYLKLTVITSKLIKDRIEYMNSQIPNPRANGRIFRCSSLHHFWRRSRL